MMKRIYPIYVVFFTFFLLLVYSCENDEKSPEIETKDEEAPLVIVQNLPEIIEVETEIKFQISDDSSIVDTELIVNGQKAATSTTNEISFIINPFDYPTGNLNIEIIAIDGSENETRVNEQIEMKRLLISVPHSNLKDNYYYDNYVMIHSLDGKLIDYQNYTSGQDIIFYGDDEKTKENIIASLFTSPTEKNSNNNFAIQTFDEVPVGTILASQSELQLEDNYEYFPDRNQNANLSVISDHLASANGYGYQGYITNTTDLPLRYSSDIANDFFLMINVPTNPISANTQEDYSYLIITDLEKTSYEQSDFLTPSSFYEVEIPDEFKTHIADNYHCTIRGFRNEQDYQNGIYHNMLQIGSAGANIYSDGFYIPIIEEFEIYEKYIRAYIGNYYSVITRQKGLSYKPMPEMNLTYDNQQITTSGNYDHILLRYADYNFEDGLKALKWSYYTKPVSNLNIPFYDIEIPTEIQKKIEMQGLRVKPETTGDFGPGINASLIKLGTKRDYTKRMFQQNNHFNDREWYELQLTLTF